MNTETQNYASESQIKRYLQVAWAVDASDEAERALDIDHARGLVDEIAALVIAISNIGEGNVGFTETFESLVLAMESLADITPEPVWWNQGI